ncbi:MAG: hypothetical protein P4N24_16045, partial [Acidobacteriota bacterium]|nr:hypothetical protein [Acidobacteriota bacterium]
MNPKTNVCLAVLLAAVFLGQIALAQQTSPSKASPVYVPLPKDIQCSVQGVSYRSEVGANGQMVNTSGSLGGVTCWVTGKTPEKKKEIPLVSTGIVRGLVTTKDFGKLKITPANNIPSSGISIAIRSDKLPALRAFLQKPEKVAAVIQSPAPIYSGIIATSNVERADLLTLPAEYEKDSLVLSEDGKHSAFVSGSHGSQRVVLDGIEGQEFRKCTNPIFSRAGKLYFWAISNGAITLSAGGGVIPTSLAGEGSIVFSRDGAHWAAFGAEQPTRNGNQITAGAIVVYVDGVNVGKYHDISYPDFSADGKHFAFISSDSGQMNLVVDGSVTTRFGQPKASSSFLVPLFMNGPNLFMETSVHYLQGGGILALAQDANGWTVYKEGKALSSYAQNVLGGEGYQVMQFS